MATISGVDFHVAGTQAGGLSNMFRRDGHFTCCPSYKSQRRRSTACREMGHRPSAQASTTTGDWPPLRLPHIDDEWRRASMPLSLMYFKRRQPPDGRD